MVKGHINNLIKNVDIETLTDSEKKLFQEYKDIRSQKVCSTKNQTGHTQEYELTKLENGRCGLCKIRKILSTGNCMDGGDYWICYKGTMDWYIVQEELKRNGFI